MERIEIGEFLRRTDLCHHTYGRVFHKIEAVVSPREITSVDHVIVMGKGYLDQLLRSVALAGNKSHFPYETCQFSLERVDPHGLVIGQRFMQRGKYIDVLENSTNLMHSEGNEQCIARGIADRNAMIIIGKDNSRQNVIAHYIPPIVEIHGEDRVLLDGIHRNYLVQRVGGTLYAVVVRGVKVEFPATLNPWSEIQVVEVKPPREYRYFGLRPELFRQLHDIGIDG